VQAASSSAINIDNAYDERLMAMLRLNARRNLEVGGGVQKFVIPAQAGIQLLRG
jgi:hypothetical protein